MHTHRIKSTFLISFIFTIAPVLSNAVEQHVSRQATTGSFAGAPVLFQRAELMASDGKSLGFMGSAVAISGDTVVLGEPGYDDGMGNYVPGSAYVYVKGSNGWQDMTQVAKLNASDGGDCSYCEFGASVGISGDTIVVASDFGEAYVFVKPANGWANMTETARLLGTPTNNCFCGGVAIAGDTIVVGSPLDSTNAGSLFVFVRPPSGWQTTSEANAQLTEAVRGYEDQLGGMVAIDGGTIVSQGLLGNKNQRAVFVFLKPQGGWSGILTQTATLTSTDPLASFLPVSVSGNTVVSGVPDPYQELPYADVWVKPATGWKDMTETARLSDGRSTNDNFGWSAATTGNLVVVGAPYVTTGKNQFRGAALVFVKPASGWQPTSKPNAVLTDSNWTNDDAFGFATAVSAGTAVVGAPNGPNKGDVGAGYVFQK